MNGPRFKIRRHRRPARFRWVAVAVAAAVMAGCAGDMSDLERYTETTKNKYQGSVEPLPQFEPYQNYVYSAFQYRSPFSPPAAPEEAEEVTEGPRPDKGRRKEPLEFYPLDSLRMVGTLEKEGEVWGLIQDPEGTIHRVQTGNHAGQNFGEITRVTSSRIDLLEIIPDGLGAWIEREVSLSLSQN